MIRLLAFCFTIFITTTAFAQSNLGNWAMYFGNLRINDRWAWHHEAQYRAYDLLPDAQQLLLRTGAQHILPNGMHATLGYAYITSWPSVDSLPAVLEHRTYQQWVMTNKVGRVKLGHRYRLEQRWINNDGAKRYANRVRYFLWADIPLNNKTVEPKTVYLSFYDEVFLEPDTWGFSQNRLFSSVGYKINKAVAVKVGHLYQYAGGGNNHRLQFGVWFRPDLRDK